LLKIQPLTKKGSTVIQTLQISYHIKNIKTIGHPSKDCKVLLRSYEGCQALVSKTFIGYRHNCILDKRTTKLRKILRQLPKLHVLNQNGSQRASKNFKKAVLEN
jgi:hypothetical protein